MVYNHIIRLRTRRAHMLARYEQRKISEGTHVSVKKYCGLTNLPHWHTEHELIYISDGKAEVMLKNSVYELNGGMCAFAAGEEIHYIHAESGSVVVIMKILPELIERITSGKELACPITADNYSAGERLEEIFTELMSGEMYSGIIADSIAVRLCAEIFRGESTVSSESSENGDSALRCKELFREINRRYSTVTFDEAAEAMGLSRPYFSKYFRRISGMTFTEYVNTVKVNAAAEMILSGGMTMTEIAISCGFGTIRSFNRIFRRYTGCTPTEFSADSGCIRSETYIDGFDPTVSG